MCGDLLHLFLSTDAILRGVYDHFVVDSYCYVKLYHVIG